MEQKIKEYLDKQKPPQKKIIIELRKLFLKTLKNPNEKYLWGVITFDTGKFYLATVGDKVHIGFSIANFTPEELELLEGSGKTMRHIKIFSLEDINEKEIVKLIKIVKR